MALCLVVGMTLPQALASAQSSPADDDLATGIRQVREGEFEAALITLDGAVRRLSGEKGQSGQLARAYTYLAIAYVGLAQQETAKAKFLEAWKADKHMTLSPKEFPPNIIEFFEQAKKEAEAKGKAEEKKPEAKTTPAAPAPAATAASGTAQKKGGSGTKIALIAGGALAAVVGVAVAAKGGSSPAPPTPPPCTQGVDFDFTVDIAFSGSVNCGTANPRTQTYRITNRSCSSITVQSLVLNRGKTAGSCNVSATQTLVLNGTTVVPAASGAPATAVIRTGAAAGTAHYLCCSKYPCIVGGCSLNEAYTVTTSAGTRTVGNTVTIVDNSGTDCVPCSGAVGPLSRGQTGARDGQPVACDGAY